MANAMRTLRGEANRDLTKLHGLMPELEGLTLINCDEGRSMRSTDAGILNKLLVNLRSMNASRAGIFSVVQSSSSSSIAGVVVTNCVGRRGRQTVKSLRIAEGLRVSFGST